MARRMVTHKVRCGDWTFRLTQRMVPGHDMGHYQTALEDGEGNLLRTGGSCCAPPDAVTPAEARKMAKEEVGRFKELLRFERRED